MQSKETQRKYGPLVYCPQLPQKLPEQPQTKMTSETYNFFTQALIIKRAEHRSVVAAAAYRAGEKLMDITRGLTFDFAPRKGVRAKKIMVPKNAPDWATRREELWNAVEQVETRKDAQLARELRLQFPHELDLETQSQMLWDYCQSNFTDAGMIVDAVIHDPGVGDGRNTHAHLLLTLRKVIEGVFGNKQREWNNTDNLEKWKIDWQRRCNEALEAIDSNIRFERRSIAAQRAEKLAAMELSEDWYEKRQLEIEAARLDYIPRPHLSSEVYRAMVEGRKIADGDKAIVKAWEAARDSKQAARDEADRLEQKLVEDIAIAPAVLTDTPFENPIQSGDISFEDELADITWKKHISKREILAGILVLLAEQNPEAEFGALLMVAKNYEIVILEAPESWPRNGFKNLREISTATRRMGWRKYPYIADILRNDIDWSDELREQHTAQAVASKELDIVVEDQSGSATAAQDSSMGGQASNPDDTAITESTVPPTLSSEDAVAEINFDDLTEPVADETPLGNDDIEELVRQSRDRVIGDARETGRVATTIAKLKSSVSAFAPIVQNMLVKATEVFLSAASALKKAWMSFRTTQTAEPVFEAVEQEFERSRDELVLAHTKLPKPNRMSARELKSERSRLKALLEFEDQELIAKVTTGMASRLDYVAACWAETEEGQVEIPLMAHSATDQKRKAAEAERRAKRDIERQQERERREERDRIEQAMKAYEAQIEQAVIICSIDYGISQFALQHGIQNFQYEVAIRDRSWAKIVDYPKTLEKSGRALLVEVILELGSDVLKRIENRTTQSVEQPNEPSGRKDPKRGDPPSNDM